MARPMTRLAAAFALILALAPVPRRRAGRPSAARRGAAARGGARHPLRPRRRDRGRARARRDRARRALHPRLEHQDVHHRGRLRHPARPRPAGRGRRRLGPAGKRAPDVVLEGHGDARLSSAPDCAVNCLAALADAVAAQDAPGPQRHRRRQLFPGPALEPGDELEQYPHPLRHRDLRAQPRRQRAALARHADRARPAAGARSPALITPSTIAR